MVMFGRKKEDRDLIVQLVNIKERECIVSFFLKFRIISQYVYLFFTFLSHSKSFILNQKISVINLILKRREK